MKLDWTAQERQTQLDARCTSNSHYYACSHRSWSAEELRNAWLWNQFTAPKPKGRSISFGPELDYHVWGGPWRRWSLQLYGNFWFYDRKRNKGWFLRPKWI